MHESKNKCYNSVSCVVSVLIVIFVLGSIIYDLCYTKPNISRNITEIRTELNIMNEKIDNFRSNMSIPVDSIEIVSVK